MKRELPPTAGLAPRWRDLVEPIGRSIDDLSPKQVWQLLRFRSARSHNPVDPDLVGTDADAMASIAAPSLSDCLAKLIGVDDMVLVNSGYAALVILFTYLKKGSHAREVIVPAFTSPKVVLAAHQAGLRVRLCDTGQSRFDFDLGMLARLVNDQTLAVVPTHFGGHVTPLKPLQVLLDGIAPHVAVVEDAAQGFGARVNGQSVGLQGDIGFFSFARGTGLTMFQGGGIISRHPIFRQGLRHIADLMQPDNLWQEWRDCLGLLAYHAFYDAEHYRLVYGASSRRKGTSWPRYAVYGEDLGDLVLHRVGAWRQDVALKALARWPQHQQQVAGRVARLYSVLQSLPLSELHLPPKGTLASNSFIFVSMASRKQADRILQLSIEQGLGVSRLYAGPLTAYPALRDIIGTSPMPQAEALAARTLTVTTSPLMTDSEIERIGRLFR